MGNLGGETQGEQVGTLPDGTAVHAYTVGSEPGPTLRVLDLGATAASLVVALPDGSRRDVVLGWDTVEQQLAHPTAYLGAIVGRYANRIAQARFELDGTTYELGANDGPSNLHGGPAGFDTRRWTRVSHGEDHVELELVSADGDQGFPGELTARVRYTFTTSGDQTMLDVDLSATTDAPTLVNLATHVYWNLAGGGSVEQHRLGVRARHYTPVDEHGIPCGDHELVDRSGFDLRRPVEVGAVVPVDHNFVLDGRGFRQVATLACAGLTMSVLTDQPGLQVYSGQALPEPFGRYGGLALEPQRYPDSPHHPEWPSTVLRPGETYRSRARFTIAPG